ncbi:MAG: hypothetical protein JXR75_12525 [Rhodobacteraceae bacterium]|nr:hypothetical protein [Paracoccaceae bacterium]
MTDPAQTLLAVRLSALAAARQTITYGDLARDLGWRIGQLTAALEALMEADAAAGRPLGAALCKARLAGEKPAPGFFAKATSLGFDTTDPVAFVAQQRAGLFGAAVTSRDPVMAPRPDCGPH